jgi:hypothetical protein
MRFSEAAFAWRQTLDSWSRTHGFDGERAWWVERAAFDGLSVMAGCGNRGLLDMRSGKLPSSTDSGVMSKSPVLISLGIISAGGGTVNGLRAMLHRPIANGMGGRERGAKPYRVRRRFRRRQVAQSAAIPDFRVLEKFAARKRRKFSFLQGKDRPDFGRRKTRARYERALCV